jgi:hypothetical protein
MGYIRIESDERVARDVKVFYVPSEGAEVDISNCVNAVALNLDIGEPVTATLRVFVGGARVTAEVTDVINLLKPKRRRPWRRLREVTRFGDRTRRLELS